MQRSAKVSSVRVSVLIAMTSVVATLIGCSSFSLSRNRNVDYSRPQKSLARKQPVDKEDFEFLKQRQMVLQQRKKLRARGELTESVMPIQQAPFPEKSENKIAAAVEVVKPVAAAEVLKKAEATVKTREPKSAADLGEQMLYSKIIETYRMREVAELKKSVQMLLKGYPDSVYADNALYLAGSLGFETNDYAYALLQMDRLINEFPNSNKVVSALLAKASIEKRQGRTAAARASLLKIQKQYPGSPEALRVSVELKLLKLAAQHNSKREG
ncbi:MAG TPA: tetratricopeptide repeat protein [Bdellovibrionales bacterium]|nr:tetratricopeptide repeat protein [Bdellovibrionales bacterium]